jgi:hypothetical protein
VVVLVLAAVGAVTGRARRSTMAWLVVGLGAWVLGWGPGASRSPYTLLYGLHAALRRFWWPLRHVVLVQVALGALATAGVAALQPRLPRAPARWLGAAAALVVGLTLALQGAPSRLEQSAIHFPPPGYAELGALEAGAVVSLPLAPEATGTNHPMLFQLAHGHPMVTGHSPWVKRARPEAWDRWVQDNGFLASMAQLERAGWAGGNLTVSPDDIAALRSAAVRWFVVDRTLVPKALGAMVLRETQLLTALFGPPVVQTADMKVWDLHQYNTTTEVRLGSWQWPAHLQPAGPEWPLAAERPPSPMLGKPSGMDGGFGWAP